ncbi:MAG: hypothetical protein ATN33_00645 [Epulopiscium sp. Nele67-Bin001]|nr:MAG: hypothetical protein ATN33_00645 [Epulopiscium sp. Nele67-Bin001]
MDILVGPQGSGKTTLCYQKIRKTLKDNKYQRIIMIVPEQFNLEAQMALSEFLFPGLLLVEVMSFNNMIRQALGHRLTEDTPIIDELERIMILKRVVEEHKSKLVYFKKGYDKNGFIEQINTLITTCEQHGLDEDNLTQALNNEDVSLLLKTKIEDVTQILKWFQNFIADKFLTIEGSMEMLKNILKQDKIYQNTLILVDGFYSFTSMQEQVLFELYHQSKQMIITLPMNKIYDDKEQIKQNNIYYNSIKTFRRIKEYVTSHNQQVSVHFSKNKFETKSSGLKYLNEHYFHTFKINNPIPNEDVLLLMHKNIRTEVSETAKRIKELVRDKNYRYNNIVVLMGNIKTYQPYISSTFAEYNIPYFLDIKRSIHTNSLVALIINLLGIVTSSWNYNFIMSFLKLEMIGLPRKDIDYLENYILAQGIKRKNKWQDEWKFGDKEWDYEKLNQSRIYNVNTITSFEKNINSYKNKLGRINVLDITKILYQFLEEHQVYERILDKIEYHKFHKNRSLELENTQIWEQVMKILESLVEILGNEEVSISTYKSILETSFSHQKMGIIPASQDEILIGEVERTRFSEKKAVFVLGANEGMLPAISSNTGIFTELDLSVINTTNPLYDAFIHNEIYGSELEIYTALNKATNLLVVNMHLSDEKGVAKRPSAVFTKLKKLFDITMVPERNFSNNIFYHQATIADVGILFRQSILGKNISNADWRDALSWYLQNEVYQNGVKHTFKNLFYNNLQEYLQNNMAQILYGDNIVSSVSQLERFRKCACSYFIEYGLKATERKLFKWESTDIGTIFHSILEIYPTKLKENNTDWLTVTKELQKHLISLAVQESLERFNKRSIEGGQVKYTASRIEKMSTRAIDAITYQLRQGKFQPQDYEYRFGDNGMPQIEIILPSGFSLFLRGTIDRVDIYMVDGEKYIKILDYKSGNTNFDLVEVYYGLQLQLLIYLDAYLKINNTCQEAGVYYFKIDVPSIKYEPGKSIETLQEELYKAFRLSGLTLGNTEIARAIEDKLDKTIINVSTTSKGALSSRSDVATEQEFENLRQHIYNVVGILGQDILDGKISANPYKLGNSTACDYCKYHGICQFDENIPNNNYDVLEKVSKKEILSKLNIPERSEDNGLDISPKIGD